MRSGALPWVAHDVDAPGMNSWGAASTAIRATLPQGRHTGAPSSSGGKVSPGAAQPSVETSRVLAV